ncbi:MAG: hypothetical protein H7239_02125, partial [Flavobacterium sp.]|nr:hypothetical protein [Flavobacterium sp.]
MAFSIGSDFRAEKKGARGDSSFVGMTKDAKTLKQVQSKITGVVRDANDVLTGVTVS